MLARSISLSVPPLCLVLASCGASAPETGALEVYASFTCAAQIVCDTDGFLVALDNKPGIRIAFSDTLQGVSVGQHTITLSDVRSTCTVFGSNPQNVIVQRDTLVQAGWTGTCQ